jgi:hypothetical protein
MKTVTLVDTRHEIAGESIGTVVSTHDTILAAFKANDDFQSRMRASGVKSHVPTKIVTLKVRLRIYGLDRLIEQGTQPLPETLLIVNPAWCRLDQSERARLYRLRAEFGARTLPAQPSAQQVQNFERRGGELRTGGLRPRVRQAATRPMHVCQARRLTQVSSPAGEAGSVRRRLRMSPCALFSCSNGG